MNKEIEKNNFSNEFVDVSIIRNPGCEVHMEVKVSKKAVEAAYKKALHNIRKEVEISGFRKGKAPEEVVVKNYKGNIEKEWRGIVTRTAYNDGCDLTKVRPLSQNSIHNVQIRKISLEDGAEVVIDFESMCLAIVSVIRPSIRSLCFVFSIFSSYISPVKSSCEII